MSLSSGLDAQDAQLLHSIPQPPALFDQLPPPIPLSIHQLEIETELRYNPLVNVSGDLSIPSVEDAPMQQAARVIDYVEPYVLQIQPVLSQGRPQPPQVEYRPEVDVA